MWHVCMKVECENSIYKSESVFINNYVAIYIFSEKYLVFTT